MLDQRQRKQAAAMAGRQLGATGGESSRAGFFMDMLAKWLWDQKSDLLEISGDGVDIHAIDEAAGKFCEYIADHGEAGYRFQENPERFIPTLKLRALERVKLYSGGVQ